MKNKNTQNFYLLILTLIFIVFFLPGVFAACVVPTNGMSITTNTVLCNGNYFLPNGISLGAGNLVLDCEGATLRGNDSGSSIGIYAGQKNFVTIKNCIIRNYYQGIKIWDSYLNSFTNNSFSNNVYGIFFDNSRNQSVLKNYFFNNSQYGFYAFWDSWGYLVEGNTFENNSFGGIAVDWFVHDSRIRYNVVKNSWMGINSACAYGDKPADSNIYTNNTVTGSYYAFSMCRSNNNLVEKNTFANSVYAFNFDRSSNNTFYYNNIIGNNNSFLYATGRNFWNLTNKGNYWSNYDTPGEGCSDGNVDGICDSPYILNVNNTDYYPLKSINIPPALPACYQNSDCGVNYFTASFCVANNLTKNLTTYTCNNPGAPTSFCSSSVNSVFNQTCSYGCTNGACNSAPINISDTELYNLLNSTFNVHMNYFLSTNAVTSYGIPLTAYKPGARARFGYSNPTEWGYLLEAYIAASERGIISSSIAAQKINVSLNTMMTLQNDGTQSYRNLFYPYYKVTQTAAPGADVFPYHDADANIPSIDNGLLYMSLLIIEGWAKDKNNSEIETKARTIKDKMNFSIFLFTSANKLYMAHTINAGTNLLGASKWDVYSDEGGLMSIIAYISKGVSLTTFKNLTNAQLRSSASWNGYTVQEAAWFNSMFAWGVRSLAGINVAGTPYSTGSFVPTTKAHLAYGTFLGISYPGFSDAMTQGLVGYYIPPNLAGVVSSPGKSSITPHAFFVPFNVIGDLDSATKSALADNIKRLQADSGAYYYSNGSYPYGFVVGASAYTNQTSYAGIIPIDGKLIFETLSEAYTTLSLFNGLQKDSKDFNYFANKVDNYSYNLGQATRFLYPSYCADNDGDSYSSVKSVCGPVDCNDNNIAINPGATEIYDSIDNDCDNQTDEGFIITCSINTQCGTNAFSGNNFCSLGNVVRNFTTFTCNNPGTVSSYCSNLPVALLNQTCSNGCTNGVCNPPPVINCSTNLQCGTNAWTGALQCSSNDSYQNYLTFTCNNPGTIGSYCTNSTPFTIKQDCGDTTYDAWSGNICEGSNVIKTRLVHNRGCSVGSCYTNDSTEKQIVQTCQYGCTNGACNSAPVINCSTNVQCGTNAFSGNNFCSSGNVFRNFITFTCANPGTGSSYCSNSSSALLNQTCSNGCTNGVCNSAPVINCSTNTQCGTDSWIGTNSCNGNNVWNTFRTFTCNNPGTVNSYCSNSSAAALNQTCLGTCSDGACVSSLCANQTCDVNRDGFIDNGKYCNGTFNTVYWSTKYNNIAFRADKWGWVYYNNSGEWLYNYGTGWYWFLGNRAVGTYPRFIWMYAPEATGRWTYGLNFDCRQNGVAY